MSRCVVVIAPHPDDETIGLGGTLLRHVEEGDLVHWIIVTSMTESTGFCAARRAQRAEEIARVHAAYGFAGRVECGLPTTRLDAIPRAEVVSSLAQAMQAVKPEVLYLPHPHDVHSDHLVVFQAAATSSKWFRNPSLREIYTYPTLSETEFGLDPGMRPFQPNVFVQIEPWLERKIEVMRIYQSELGAFPFPRSEEAMRAQAAVYGAQSGVAAAEALCLLRCLR